MRITSFYPFLLYHCANSSFNGFQEMDIMNTLFHPVGVVKAFIQRNVPGRYADRSQARRSFPALILILLITVMLSLTGLGCGGGGGAEAVAPGSSGPGLTGANTGSATLVWNAPATNMDGSPLNDLAGYKIYYGVAPGVYTMAVDVGSNTSYQISNLAVGMTYYFTVTAYNTTGSESEYATPPVSKTISE
jgi:hypothetical protein